MVILEAALVTPHPLLELVETVGEGRMGVTARAGRHQALSRGETDPAVHLEAVAVLGHDHLGVLPASFEILADSVLEFLGDARA